MRVEVILQLGIIEPRRKKYLCGQNRSVPLYLEGPSISVADIQAMSDPTDSKVRSRTREVG